MYIEKRRRFPLRLVIILLVLAAVGFFAYRHFTAKPATPPAPPPPAVTVEAVEVRDIPLEFDYAARLAGSREVEIRARVGGTLLKREYEEGAYVKRGDTLFQIDPDPYYAALAEAQATFNQAARDWQRARTLMNSKALSAREFDQAQALYGQSKALLETAKINLAYTTVRAPISGFTSEEGFSEGSLVVADTSLLTRLTQLDPMYVEFAYPDSDAMMQRAGVANGSITLPEDNMLRVSITFTDGSVYPSEGKIRFTDSIIDPNTGTVRARAVVPNAGKAILPGQFVHVTVKGLTQKQAIGVPEKAIMQGPMGMFVYTVGAEDKAVITPVELGLLNNGTRVITKGLKAGDRVVTEGMIKVRPDSPVRIDTGAAAQDGAAAPAAAPAPQAKE